jgi:hypothetical protein
MKKNTFYILLSGLLLSAGLATAQTQTGTGTSSSAAQTTPVQGSSNYNSANMTPVNSSALPDPLQSTLQSNQQYKGWENGQWYFNSTTNQYSVQMPSVDTGSPANPLGTNSTVPASTTPTGQSSPLNGLSTPTTNPTNPSALPGAPTTTPVNPVSTTPVSGMQLPGTTPTAPTWYRFDQNGRLIPQPN